MSEPAVFERTVFEKIAAREIPADILFEDGDLIVIRDIAPKAPVHLLVVPKTSKYRNVAELSEGDPGLLGKIVARAQALATEYTGGDFRLIFNTGPGAGQTVFHVHAHVLGELPGSGATLGEGSIGLQ